MKKVNIFTPTYHRLEITKRCFDTLIPQVNSSIYDTHLHICDNNSNESMKEWLKTLSDGKRIHVHFSDKNIGKAAIVNKIYKKNNDCTHIISIDSDMYYTEEGNFIDKMVWCSEHFHKFGLLSTLQLTNDQHLWKGLDNIMIKEHHEVAYGRFNHVAGGCVILKKEIWDMIGGYSTYGGVYGFDDGLMMQDVHKRGYLTGVIKTIKLVHPNDDDVDYKKWKIQNIQKRRQEGYYENR